MTDTKGISKNTIAQQFSITDDASSLPKHLKSNIAYDVKNVSSSGSKLQLEIQINGKWEKVSLALDSINNKDIKLNDGKLIINGDGSKITLIANTNKITSPLSTQDILKILNLFVQPKAQKETFIDKGFTLKANQEVSLLAKLNKNLKNTLSIPSLKANIQLPPNIANQINSNSHILLNLQESNKQISAKVFLPKSTSPALELKVPIEKVTQWLKTTPVDLMIKNTNSANTQIKQNNNIAVVNVNISESIPKWQNAKLITQGNTTQIKPISPPITLNLTKSIFTSLMNNGVKTDTDTNLNKHTKDSIHQNIVINESNKLTIQKPKDQTTANLAISKGDNFKAPLEKIVNSFKAALSLNAKQNETRQIKLEIASPISENKNKQVVETQTSKAINTTAKDLPTQTQKHQVQQATIKKDIKQAAKQTDVSSMKVELKPELEPHKGNKQINLNLINKLTTSQKINPDQRFEHHIETKQTTVPKTSPGSTAHIKTENILNINSDPETPNLNKLVNHAFSRMINQTNVSADKIRTEILSSVQPNLLNKTEKENTFNNSLQDLALTLLTSHSVSENVQSNTDLANKQSLKLDQLLQLIFPGLKLKTANVIKETNTKSGLALLQELGQIQQTVQQSQQQLIQGQSVNNQTDNLSNSILQFLLPMQLPDTVKQTEIDLGHYKKNTQNGEGKDVWFIRLNFNFETLGQLQANAQLMDKNVDCTFSSLNQSLIDKAQPYIQMLKQRLIEHGLSVGKMAIELTSERTKDNYKAHSIINIKV